MLKILFVLFLVRTPVYYVYDPLGKGIEPLLKNDGIKIVKKVDKYTWLVEGDLEKVNTGIHRIARYFEPKGKIAPLDIKTPDIHWDPFIDSVLSTISLDSLKATIQRLQDFKTRYAYTDSCRAAEEWLKNKISTYVDSSILWSFEYKGTWMRNVIGYKAGSMDEFVMITSHLDAITYADPYNVAPGADDNASGTAVVMEAARILKGIETGTSIRFVPFTAEELGLIGSEHYADYIYTNNEPLLATLNFDMVGYQTNDGKDFEIYGDSSSIAYKVMVQVAQLYTNTYNEYIPQYTWGSDHAPFADYGYAWTFVIESSYYLNPNYHQPSDLISTIDDSLLLNAARIGIATLLYLSLYPFPPENLHVFDAGTGDSIVVKWSPHAWSDVSFYRVYLGTSHNIYSDTIATTDTILGIGGLTEGLTYYIRVQANTDSRDGFLSQELDIIPSRVPASPSIINIQPDSNYIKIMWHPNQELDILGYNIYRKIEGETTFIKLNTSLLNDTVFIDSSASQPLWHYYYLTAVDQNINESSPSCTLAARPLTLSEGVGIVDGFKDGSGTPFLPNQEMQKAFLDSVFGDFSYTLYNMDSINLTMSHIGIHKIIYLVSDDYYDFEAKKYRELIENYLERGGKLIVSGWKISQNLLDANYNNEFHDTILGLPIDSIYLNNSLDFIGAIQLSDFPALHLDTTKIPSRYNGMLPNIEAFTIENGFPIYGFDSYNNNPFWEGKTCGFMTADSTIIYLGFPLYYMRVSDARNFMFKALSELVSVEERNKPVSFVSSIRLVNRVLHYDFTNKVEGVITFDFYNILGQKIYTTKTTSMKGEIALNNLKKGVIFLIVKDKNRELLKFKIVIFN